MNKEFELKYYEAIKFTSKAHAKFGRYFSPLSMSMSPQSLAYMLALLEHYRPHLAFDIGTGMSTLVMTEWKRLEPEYWSEKLNRWEYIKPTIYHVEDKIDYWNKVKSFVSDNSDTPENVIHSYSELYKMSISEGISPWFSLSDGNRTQRKYTVDWLMKQPIENAIIIFDDANRTEVSQDVARFHDSNKGKGRFLFSKNMTKDKHGRYCAVWVGVNVENE